MSAIPTDLQRFGSPAVGAVVETCFLALLRNGNLPAIVRVALGVDAADGGKVDMQSVGRYIDRFEKRDGAAEFGLGAA